MAIPYSAIATNLVLEAVDRALKEYSPENIDLVENEEESLDLIFHSSDNSFIIERNIADTIRVNLEVVTRYLDEKNIGYDL